MSSPERGGPPFDEVRSETEGLREQISNLERYVDQVGDELREKSAECEQLEKQLLRMKREAHNFFYPALRHAFRHPKNFLRETAQLFTKSPARRPSRPSFFRRVLQHRRDRADLEAAIKQWLVSAAATGSDSRPPFYLLLVGHEASLTGAPRVLLELGRELKAHYQVHLLFVFLEGGGLLEDFQAVAPCLVLGESQLALKEKISRVVNCFSGLPGPKGAIVNTVLTAGFLEPLAQRAIPAFCWVHDSVSCVRDHCRGAATMAEIRQYAKKIVYSSPANLAAARNAFGLEESATAAIRYGLRPLKQMAREDAKEKLPDRLRDRGDAPLIFGCGTVQPRKGTDLFVEAALFALQRCPANVPLPQFVWVGKELDAAYARKVRSIIAADRLGTHIHLVDESIAVETYFAACDLFLLTSRDDPYPVVTLEAMSWARPVLAFAQATGQEELFEELLPPGNPRAMGGKILEFLADPVSFEKAGRRGQARVHELLSWRESARNFAELLELEPAQT